MARSGLLIALLALSAAGCTVSTTGACRTDTDCLDGATCVDGVCEGGPVPTAQFTAPASVGLGAAVTLDASGSVGGDGRKEGLVYRWTVLQPADVALASATASLTSFVAASPHATYKVQLVVVDRGTASAPVVHDVAVENAKPTARLAEPADFARNAMIELDATGSSDPDRDNLTWTWELTKEPATANGTLNPTMSGRATLTTGGEAVTYTIKVTVSDGTLSDSTTIVRSIGNTPPFVDPGPPLSVDHGCNTDPSGTTCTAAGTLSGLVTDADGAVDASATAWRVKSAPPASHAEVTFTPEGIDAATSTFKITASAADPIVGEYEFELTGRDNDGASASRSVVVTVGNRPPTLSLSTASPTVVPHVYDPRGAKFVATVGLQATLQDPDGDPLDVVWDPLETTLQGARVDLTPGTGGAAQYRITVDAANPRSLIDGNKSLYTISAHILEVNGGRADATLPVIVANQPPFASSPGVAGLAPGHKYGPVAGVAGGPFYSKTYPLTWAVSDPDGDPITTDWKVDGVSSVTTGTATEPQITVYDASVNITSASLLARGAATDPFGGTAPSNASLPPMGNRPPVVSGLGPGATGGHTYGVLAGAGASPVYSQQFSIGVLSASDPDGDPLVGTWTATLAAAPSLRISTNASGAAATAITLYASEPALVGQPVNVALSVADGSTATAMSAKFTMGNRAPTLSNASDGPSVVNSGMASSPACVQCSASFTCTQSRPATQFNMPSGIGAYTPKFDATAIDPDGDPIVVEWTVRPNGNANQLLGAVKQSCTSGAPCPTISTVGLGAGLLGVPACGGRPPLGSFLEQDILTATPSDAIGLAGPGLDRPILIQAGCSPSCG